MHSKTSALGVENKKILFVSALASELKIIKEEIKKLNISKKLEISFFECGMGNYKTIMNLCLYLTKQKFDFIVNIGVCGYSEKYEKIIQISRIKNISNDKELISPIFFEFFKIKSIACSEKIIFDLNFLEGEKFVDMESYGFEMVCDKFDTPRIILKIPVDKIGEETKNFDFEKAKKYLRENIEYSELIEKIEKYLKFPLNSPFQEGEIVIKNKILNFYKWTFTEKIILDKELNKFIVLELGDLEEFFVENKTLGKKEFFRKLKNTRG